MSIFLLGIMRIKGILFYRFWLLYYLFFLVLLLWIINTISRLFSQVRIVNIVLIICIFLGDGVSFGKIDNSLSLY